MAIQLVGWGDMNKKSEDCQFPFKTEMAHVEDMFNVMKKLNGVSVAAPQIGIFKRFFIMNHTGRFDQTRLVVNPKILMHGKEQINSREGCLNLPGYFASVPRWAILEVEYWTLNESGKLVYASARIKRFEAIVFQHAFEYLDGLNSVVKDFQKAQEILRQKSPVSVLSATN